MENVTSADQLELLEMSRYSAFGVRDRGTGRPTKKDRRDLEVYMEYEDEDMFFDFDDDDEE
jgi:ribosome-associated heat shock protein Hsp15